MQKKISVQTCSLFLLVFMASSLHSSGAKHTVKNKPQKECNEIHARKVAEIYAREAAEIYAREAAEVESLMNEVGYQCCREENGFATFSFKGISSTLDIKLEPNMKMHWEKDSLGLAIILNNAVNPYGNNSLEVKKRTIYPILGFYKIEKIDGSIEKIYLNENHYKTLAWSTITADGQEEITMFKDETKYTTKHNK